jgi:hypothetical protein
MILPLGIAGSDVACHSFIKSEARKKAKGCGQSLLTMLPLFFSGRKSRRSRDV